MVDREYPPLTATCVKNLHDKLYDKRKLSALEIEKQVREFLESGNYTQIENIIGILGENFSKSSNCHVRKGGLIGLAAVAIGLGKTAPHYCSTLVVPVIRCLSDIDSRVRYYACEALYNIVKITKDESLRYFNDIFDALSKCAADPDSSVRKASSQLNGVMKVIVMESPAFDLPAFIPVLREKIYTKNPYARQFMVSWVSTLDSVPDINMTIVLPDIIDGLFQILSDPNEEIRTKCVMLLEELLHGIQKSPCEVNYASMVNILIVQCQQYSVIPDGDTYITLLTAVEWLHQFMLQASSAMLPYTSGIISSILPCFAFAINERKKDVVDKAISVNELLINLVKSTASETDDVIPCKAIRQKGDDETPCGLKVSSTLEVVCRLTYHSCEMTRLAAIRWLDTLIQSRPRLFFVHTEEIFPLLLKILSDSSTAVVHWNLELVCKLSSHPAGLEVLSHVNPDLLRVPDALKAVLPPDTNPYLLRFMVDLEKLFDTDQRMLIDRGELIITDLCSNLKAESIYRILAEIIIQLDDYRSAFTLVQSLNRILLTQSALHEFRIQLKQLTTESSCFLFCCLYRAWSHNPAALLSLCLLTQNYDHACVLIKYFGEMEITVETLTEIDQLIQLLESPIFAYLRLHLLDSRYSSSLQETLYCLLMCLPQTEAFHMLRRRLDCIPRVAIQGHKVIIRDNDLRDTDIIAKYIDFDKLLAHFQSLQIKRRTLRNAKLRESRLHRTLPLTTPSDPAAAKSDPSHPSLESLATLPVSQIMKTSDRQPATDSGIRSAVDGSLVSASSLSTETESILEGLMPAIVDTDST